MVDQIANKKGGTNFPDTMLDSQSMVMENLWLRNVFEGGPVGNPLPEIQKICSEIASEDISSFIDQVHNDLTSIFSGNFLDFRESFVKYHDLRHTRNVTLATVRLFHGLSCEGVAMKTDLIKLGILCAYFHDTGMLLTEGDEAQSGAAYLKCHEERSIAFIRKYMQKIGFPKFGIQSCEAIINCTNLTIEPEDIQFESQELETVGHVLGTADILAQMADRYYLECLPLLYNEQLDAGIQQHPSSLALMRQTTHFYHKVIEKRLKQGFNNVCGSMQTHFKEWWQLDKNLYLEFIEKNINYLEDVVQKYDSGEGEFREYLRRKQPKI